MPVAELQLNTVLDSLLRLGRTWHPAAETLQMPAYRDGSRLLTERLVQSAHAHGMEVYAWTINDTAQMQSLISAGVNGIITDYPDRLLEVLGRGVRSEEK